MSSLAFLVTELQSLASETKRKHPEVREAAEKSLQILRTSPSLDVASAQSEDLLRPVFMGCATRNAKVVAISLGSLQRLIALKAVPAHTVPSIISTLREASTQGVDIQLRILQTLLSLITNFGSVHGELLSEGLLVCFKLQESRIGVVSSTAAATLRQLVMHVVEKVVDEDRERTTDQSDKPAETQGHGRSESAQISPLPPSLSDAHDIFLDLCLLASSQAPHFLKLDHLHKTFALELIESVLSNYSAVFIRHPELMSIITTQLSPLLLKSMSSSPVFPLTLRSTRVVFIILKRFLSKVEADAEVFLSTLVRIISGEGEDRPAWTRVLAMEVLRGVCADAELMRTIYVTYDAKGEQGSQVYGSLVDALARLVSERPALLGISTQLQGTGHGSGSAHSGGEPSTPSAIAFDLVANALSSTHGAGLSIQGSSMKLQCIDQLDKADAPPVPEAYVYLLGLQCLVTMSEGFAGGVLGVYVKEAKRLQREKGAGEGVIRVPGIMDIGKLKGAEKEQVEAVKMMVERGWPALLAALSFIIATDLSDELFANVLVAIDGLTKVSGVLGQSIPRQAFFSGLSRCAIPPRVVSSLASGIETPNTPRSGVSLAGFTSTPQTPSLSDRNLACLKVLIGCAAFLAGGLGNGWFDILETLQNADYVLSASRGGEKAPPSRRNSVMRSASGTLLSESGGAVHPLLVDLDTESVQSAIQRLFDSSKDLEDLAFGEFIKALCRLSSEMVGMQSDEAGDILNHEGDEEGAEEEQIFGTPTGLTAPPAHRRRLSGIHLPRTVRSKDFGIHKLSDVAMLNIHRFIYRSPDIAWEPTTRHLLNVTLLSSAPQSIRMQAARVLDDILIVVPRNVSKSDELQAKVQRRVIDVLAAQVIPKSSSMATTSNGVELRKMGLETMHQILQASGHTLLVGWETIFEMLASVCTTPTVDATPGSPKAPRRRRLSLVGYATEKNYAALVKIAFQSLTLVCDSVSTLSPEHLRLCIVTLGKFGRQADTNIALTAAASLLWSVSDAIQAKRKDVAQEPEYSAIWMLLLLEILALCTDPRSEVRTGAIQTLFRTIQLYGSTLSESTWEECIWKITFPLMDALSVELRRISSNLDTINETGTTEQAWDSSMVLALQSIGAIMHDFLALKIMRLGSFSRTWDVFVTHIQDTVLLDNKATSAPALRCLETALKATVTVDTPLKGITADAGERVWQACDIIGSAVMQRTPQLPMEGVQPYTPFTQECLLALVDVITATREVNNIVNGVEWPLDHLSRLMSILKAILTYTQSDDYRPDVDNLTPVQAVVMTAISTIKLDAEGSASLIIRDLSEFATLAYVASFDVPPEPTLNASSAKLPAKRITYIALTKKTIPLLVEFYQRFKDEVLIYVDGTFEAVLSAFSIPIKLKYDCPLASKFGKAEPLWKSATTNFLKVVKECASRVESFGDTIPTERVDGIWRQLIDVFRGGILADCSTTESFPLDVQESEENFDLALIASLEMDVVPHLGAARVPDSVITQLAKVLHQGSKLNNLEDDEMPVSPSFSSPGKSKINGHSSSKRPSQEAVGSTASGTSVPRERFSYWCLDLLFLICSSTSKDLITQSARQRVAALSLPAMLNRCQSAMVGYVADEALRGNLPFPRSREDELLYIMRKLLGLRLWPGSLWAALSNAPTTYCVHQPPIDALLSPSQLITDAIKRSSVAHLFHFYSVFCDIASIPRKTPSAWVMFDTTTNEAAPEGLIELDARSLARQALKLIGSEMGMGTR